MSNPDARFIRTRFHARTASAGESCEQTELGWRLAPVEVDPAHLVRVGGDGDHPGRPGARQPVQQQVGEQLRREVVDRERAFEAIGGDMPGVPVAAGVLYQHIDPRQGHEHPSWPFPGRSPCRCRRCLRSPARSYRPTAPGESPPRVPSYLTSALVTNPRPTARGMTSQITAVTAILAHCSPVREPLKSNRGAWA